MHGAESAKEYTMKNFAMFVIVIFSFLLTACPGPDDSGDTGVEGFGSILATLVVNGLDIEDDAEAISETAPQESYTGVTGEPLEVPAGHWEVRAGSGPPTNDGLPTVEVGGERWVVCPAAVSVTTGREKPVGLGANRDIEIPNAHCVDDLGSEYPPRTMFVESCSLIDIGFFTGQGDYIEVRVDELVLVGPSADLGGEIVDFSFTSTSFWIEWSNGFELTCD